MEKTEIQEVVESVVAEPVGLDVKKVAVTGALVVAGVGVLVLLPKALKVMKSKFSKLFKKQVAIPDDQPGEVNPEPDPKEEE